MKIVHPFAPKRVPSSPFFKRLMEDLRDGMTPAQMLELERLARLCRFEEVGARVLASRTSEMDRQRKQDDPDHASVARDDSRALGLQRVNAHHSRLKTFINHQARGISTRYLEHYIA